MDAFTDPTLEAVTVMKSARVGYTQILVNYSGFCIAQAPRRLMILQPTVEDAEDFSKDDIDRLLDWPAIKGKVVDGSRKASNTIKRKFFPGGSLRISGANSPRAFRRVTLDSVCFDEVDGYDATAGQEGDQIDLGTKRTTTSHDRKIIVGSTPTIAKHSRIEKRFALSDQRQYMVRCPHCGTEQRLIWGKPNGPGIKWPEGQPHLAWYQCAGPKACRIEESHKPAMIAAGRWQAFNPAAAGHAGFFVWAGYSLFPNAAWGKLAAEFLEVKSDPNRLRVFANTVLGETFAVKGEAPEWERLYERREEWDPRFLPAGVLCLTIGIDVQKDRIEAFVWGWGRGKQCWLIEHQICLGSPFEPAAWNQLTEFVGRSWTHSAAGVDVKPLRIAIDEGYATTQVHAWVRRFPPTLVMAVKGATSLGAPPLSAPKLMDAEIAGKRRSSGRRTWMIGGHILTLELYGLLNLAKPTAEDLAAGKRFPPGYVHLGPAATAEICKQMGGDQFIEATGKWDQTYATEALDGWKYARAAAIAAGIEKWRNADWSAAERHLGIGPDAVPEPRAAEAAIDEPKAPESAWPAPPGQSRAAPALTRKERRKQARQPWINPGAGDWFGRR